MTDGQIDEIPALLTEGGPLVELFQKLFVRFEFLGEKLIAMHKVELSNTEASESSNAGVRSQTTKSKSSQKRSQSGSKIKGQRNHMSSTTKRRKL